MSQLDTEKFLDAMYAFASTKIRPQLDKFATLVTMTNESLGQSYKEGYEMVKSKDATNTDWPDIPEDKWRTWGGMGVEALYAHVTGARTKTFLSQTYGSYIQNTKIVFWGNREYKTNHDKAKLAGRRALEAYFKEVGKGRKFLGLKAQQEREGVGFAPGNLITTKGAGQSEVGLFNSGSHRSHKGVTTVGAAQFVAAWTFISKDSNMSGMLSAESTPQSLKDLFDEISLIFQTEGTSNVGASGEAIMSINHEQSISMTLGPKSGNAPSIEANDWGNLRPLLEKAMGAYIDTIALEKRKGSKSIEDDAVDKAEYNIIKRLTKGKNATTKSNPKPIGIKPQNVKRIVGKKRASPTGSTKKAKTRAKKSNTTQVATATNILSLAALINAKLPETVRKNMKLPGLVNRTGRFANSVKLVDAMYTKQGYPSFGYTYQKDPYQVFEPSSGAAPWGTQARDPKKLIDRSIREIAATLLQGRFFTRRV
jgi:hypothetical protein|tara:strand:+ start:6839 stop:8278 length:1440 start_codon:yes stop_codon:yes gene_type:complete